MAIPSSVLKGSVGFGGRNERTDVQLVQTLLNAVPTAKGGPFPALSQDGLCGPLTSGAIRQFQMRNQCSTDGRIDVAGKTERTLLALLEELGKLADLLGGAVGKGVGAPISGGPTAAGPNSPVRRKYLQTARMLVPQSGLTAGNKPTGLAEKPDAPKATGCGEFPGRVFANLPVLHPGQPGAFKINVPSIGICFLTSPVPHWNRVAKAIDDKYSPARKCWVPFTGANRPLPGDIYVLWVHGKPEAFQHVGVIFDATGSTWTTCDAGQGNGWQSGIMKREFESSGVMTGEQGKKAQLAGWVDLDNLYAVAQSSFPAL
jgi:peptidoglycan hydrolase-like protein with peptidoglycan-binding domain